MNISPDEQGLPQPVGDEPSSNDEMPSRVTSLGEEIISTWGKTVRTIFIVIVVLGLMIFGLWLLPIDLHVGPVQVTRH